MRASVFWIDFLRTKSVPVDGLDLVRQLLRVAACEAQRIQEISASSTVRCRARRAQNARDRIRPSPTKQAVRKSRNQSGGEGRRVDEVSRSIRCKEAGRVFQTRIF